MALTLLIAGAYAGYVAQQQAELAKCDESINLEGKTKVLLKDTGIGDSIDMSQLVQGRLPTGSPALAPAHGRNSEKESFSGRMANFGQR